VSGLQGGMAIHRTELRCHLGMDMTVGVGTGDWSLGIGSWSKGKAVALQPQGIQGNSRVWSDKQVVQVDLAAVRGPVDIRSTVGNSC